MAAAVSLDSAASPWSPWPRPGRRRWRTASSPARAEIPLAGEAPRRGHPHLRPSRLACAGTEAGGLALTGVTHREWMSSLRRFAFPRIGKMPVSDVTSADVLEILTPYLAPEGLQTARRVRQRLRAVLEWAVAMEYRIDNPCDRIGPVLGQPTGRCPRTCGPCPMGRWLLRSSRCRQRRRRTCRQAGIRVPGVDRLV